MKPLFIRHRINSAEELFTVDKSMGVEMDLRADVHEKSKLYVAHDPWVKGESFTNWLNAFKKANLQGPILLNTKEDGLESEIFNQLESYGIKNFLFIDTTVPTLVKWAEQGKGRYFAVRYSQFEPMEFTLKFKGKCDWVWADCFKGELPSLNELTLLKKDFKICLVSPELHAKQKELIQEFKAFLTLADAICTKFPECWIIP